MEMKFLDVVAGYDRNQTMKYYQSDMKSLFQGSERRKYPFRSMFLGHWNRLTEYLSLVLLEC